jgi:GntR family transcriptional regulator/MocR family aminotransferase
VDAYTQLAAEGYLSARQGSATRVARIRPVPASRPRAPAGHPVRFDFRPGVPDLGVFPRQAWLRSLSAAVRGVPASQLLYGPAKGAGELREALAGYLRRVRGVVASADDIVLCTGVAQAMHLLAALLLEDRRPVLAVEDPSHFDVREFALREGLRPLMVPVDEGGLDVGALARSEATAVQVTPAHQFPMGVVMEPGRRGELIAWAGRTGGLVIEDDYDAEFRYDRAPVGAVQGLAPEHVVYLSSVSKTLAPGLRLGWLVAPPRLAERLAALKRRNDLGSPVLDQVALAHYLESGGYDRHVRRMRLLYRRRRDALVAALRASLPGVRLHGVAAGIHLVVELPPGLDENAVVTAALRRSVRVYGLSRYGERRLPPGLVLGYASLAPSAIEEGVALLAAAAGATAGVGRADPAPHRP